MSPTNKARYTREVGQGLYLSSLDRLAKGSKTEDRINPFKSHIHVITCNGWMHRPKDQRSNKAGFRATKHETRNDISNALNFPVLFFPGVLIRANLGYQELLILPGSHPDHHGI